MPSLLRIFFFLSISLLVAGPAWSSDILTASVVIDATAQTTSAARERALKEGQQQAFRRLLESMTVESDHGRLPNPGHWQDWEIDFSVDQEKTTPVRYLAILTVRFKAQPVRALLRQAGISFAETASKPVLVVPVLYKSGRWMMWDDDNVWLKAWQERPKLSGLVPVLSPQGDNWDRQAFDAGADKERLASLGRRYGASQALIAEARQNGNNLDIRLVYSNGSATAFTVSGGEPTSALYRQGVDRTVLQIEELWKRSNLLSHESSGVVLVTISFNGMADWLRIREKLERISLIRRQEMVELARNSASLALYHAGTIDQLRTALSQSDLTLTTDSQGANTLALSPNTQR